MRRTIIAVSLTANSVWLLAQSAPQQPAFRGSTLLIVQTVTVRDRKGKPVEGLTAADFIVTENGEPQDIAFVEYQRLDAAPLGTTEIAPAVPAPVAAIAPVTDALVSVPLSGDPRYRSRRLVVLYFDLSNMSFFDQSRIFDSVRTYLDTQMTAADLVSVMVFQDSRVRLKQEFTDDRPALRRVIADLERAADERERGASTIFAEVGAAFGEDNDTFNMFTTDRQLAALQTAITGLAPLPELKTLIYLGSGLQANGADNLAQLRATVNAAVRSNVTINPIDTRGLQATAPMGNAMRASPGGIGMFSGAIAEAAIRRQQAGQDTYYALAKDTGGRAMFDSNDLFLGIVQATQAVTGYYMIGYYTKNLAKDGKFRRVKVALSSTSAPNADLSYRPGYYGTKEWAKFNAVDKERQLEEALRLEDPITEIPMAMEINYFQVSSAEYFLPVSVRMPGSELARPRPAGATKALIDMLAEIKDDYGVTIRNARDKLEFKLDPAAAVEVSRRPLQYETGFTLLPGSYVIKVLARDATTGRIGTFIKPFVVPNLDREKARLPISTVVLSAQRVVPADALYTVQQKISATSANPLVYNGLKLIPSVSRTFGASVPLLIFLQAYERDLPPPAATARQALPPPAATARQDLSAASTMRPLVAFAAFYRDGVKIFETEAAGIESWDPKSRTVPIRLSIAAGHMEPGAYECQVTVLDPAAGKAAFWRGPVTVTR
jgi:VWFA-related protein